jgi:hypothetical protein
VNTFNLLPWILATAALAGSAQAQQIWRCGPDGRTFSDTPCKDGKTMQLPDSRPQTDRAEALLIAARERDLAERLTQERLQREAEQAGGLSGIRDTAREERERSFSHSRPAGKLGQWDRKQERRYPPPRERWVPEPYWIEDARTSPSTPPSFPRKPG